MPEELEYTLRFWLRGTRLSAHSIDVPLHITVANLKHRLVESGLSVSLPSHGLRLYSVVQNVGIRDLKKLGDFSISQLGEALDAQDTLQEMIRQPSSKRFHFIAEGLVPIRCFLRGDLKGCSFEVCICLNITVDGLKNEFQKTGLPGVLAHRMKIYKITTYQDPELSDVIHTHGSGELLMGDAWVEDVFNDIPFCRSPHVVIEVAEPAPLTQSVPPIAINDPRDQYFKELDKTPLMAPSEQATPSKFIDLQASDCRIEWTRPSGSVGIPVTLLDPVFGQFVDECYDVQHDCETDHDTNTLVARLWSEMYPLFDKEKDRQEAFIRVMKSIKITIVPSSSHGFTTDGDLHVNGDRYMILEVKAEVGSKAAEPYCQGILYYVKGIEQDAKVAHRTGMPFNFPCLVVTLFGPHLAFSGAVWGVRPIYQVLSTPLPLFYHPTDTTMRRIVARHLAAFQNVLKALKSRYKHYHTTPADFKDLQPEYPHPRAYHSSDGKKTSFRYIRTLQQGKLLFVVKTDEGEDLCIKFVRTYDPEAHAQCASWGITPSLRAFVDNMPGGWKMVVMDLLEGYRCLFEVKDTFTSEEQEMLKDGLRTKLIELHQLGSVHGDVRDANVMVSNDRLEWRLVDFDWSGEIGCVRYPMNVNRSQGLARPPDALDGKLILPQHDIEMVDYLFD